MARPRDVSVVVTTIGRPELQRAVRSALNQTLEPIEVVVVYDSHVDEPRLDIPKVDIPVRVMRSNGSGANAARNTGVRAARGTFVALLDDDDYWFVDKLRAQVDCAIETRAAITACQAFDEYRGRVVPKRVFDGVDPSTYLFCKPLLHPLFDAQIQTSGLLILRSVLLRQPFDESVRFHQDWDWIIKAGRDFGACIATVRRPLYFFAANAEGKVSRRSRILHEQAWAESTLVAGSRALFGYYWTISVARAIEAGEYRLAARAMWQSFQQGKFHFGTLISGLTYAFGILLRRKVARVEMFASAPDGTCPGGRQP